MITQIYVSKLHYYDKKPAHSPKKNTTKSKEPPPGAKGVGEMTWRLQYGLKKHKEFINIVHQNIFIPI
jgi:hypothetical protein